MVIKPKVNFTLILAISQNNLRLFCILCVIVIIEVTDIFGVTKKTKATNEKIDSDFNSYRI